MSELIWSDQPTLRRPLLLVAFEGIFDAAEAATTALDWICQRSESTQIGEIDPETFFNFQEARPTTRFGPDGERIIDWPSTEITAVRTDSPRDLVIMTGVEPHLRWAAYSDHIIEVVRRSGCEMVVTVGALVAMVPHTRPFPVTGSAVHPDLARRLNLSQPTYQGPTSLAGVINARLERADVPVISLRVAVPHYVPGPPNPKATRALLRRLEQTTGVSTDYEELDREVSEWSSRVDQAVASDEESRQYVARLENQVDSNEELLPSGDDLAAELEAFLRNQRRREGGPDPESGAVLPGDEAPEGTVPPGDEASEGTASPGDAPEGTASPGEAPTDDEAGPRDEVGHPPADGETAGGDPQAGGGAPADGDEGDPD
ncbi:MAG: PAC2 family protein [Acidimicrobiales bacterium]